MKKKDFIALGIDEETAVKLEKESEKELANYVEKKDYDALKLTNDKLENDLKDRDKQLDGLKDLDDTNQTLQDEIAKLQTDNKRQSARYSIEKQLMKNGAKNTDAVMAVLKVNNDDFLDSIEIDSDGNIKGLDEKIKGSKTSDAYLWDEGVKTKKVKGATPAESGDDKPYSKNEDVDFSKMSYEDTVAYMESQQNQ